MDESGLKRLTVTLQLIQFAILNATVLYVVVAWMVTRSSEPALEGATPEWLPHVLAALGLAALVAAGPVSKLLMRSQKARSGSGPQGLRQAIMQSHIIGAAIRESAAIYGLVATFVTGSMLWVGGMSLLTVLALLATWPTRSRLQPLVGIDETAPIEP